MIRSYIKGIVREVLNSPAEGPQILRDRGSTVEEALSNTAPSHMIFHIENGFVVVARNLHEPIGRSMNLPVFCKTGEEIAEAIITEAVKDKLSVGNSKLTQSLAEHIGGRAVHNTKPY